eukprot:3090299-Rhodomonas_salina.3
MPLFATVSRAHASGPRNTTSGKHVQTSESLGQTLRQVGCSGLTVRRRTDTLRALASTLGILEEGIRRPERVLASPRQSFAPTRRPCPTPDPDMR